VRRCIVLLKYKSLNVTFVLVRIMDLNVDLFHKWDKKWNDTLISVLYVVNSTFIFPISLLFVVFLIYLLACRLSRLFPAF